MKSVFAVAAHPDDIEFLMAGTLIHLQQVGYAIHYMTVANGCCGSSDLGPEEIASIRASESLDACRLLDAQHHASIANDLEVFYQRDLLLKLSSVMRNVAPEIVLTHALSDYMEDHMETARLTVTAAFSMGMGNFPVDPPQPAVFQDVAVYHAQPYTNRDPINRPVKPKLAVDVSTLQRQKRDLLACHRSQKEWLDKSQGVDSYLDALSDLDRQVGEFSSRFEYAEGWTQHNSIGFGPEGWDPLSTALGWGKVESVDGGSSPDIEA